jgi:Spy/CpxP family protein refolding chaperone
MARHIAWGIALLLLGSVPGRAAEICEKEQPAQQRNGAAGAKPDQKSDGDKGHQAPPPKWWIDTKLRAELAITDQQSALVEQVWSKTAPGLRDARVKLQKLEDTLSQMTESNTDEPAVKAQIELVENTRAELNKGRTLMIYRMNKILTADQRAKVRKMYEGRDPNKRGSSPR